jgi:hypothetical protein
LNSDGSLAIRFSLDLSSLQPLVQIDNSAFIITDVSSQEIPVQFKYIGIRSNSILIKMKAVNNIIDKTVLSITIAKVLAFQDPFTT